MDFGAVIHSYGGPVLFVWAWLQGEAAVIVGGSLAAQGDWPGWAVWLPACVPATPRHQIHFAPRRSRRAREGGNLRGMGVRIVQVDASASRPFSGNPAAVCILPGPRDERWMQDVAREMNLAETAFLHQENGGYRLRWFTPAVEVALCGHAPLATAHVLWEEGHLPPDQTPPFHTQSGLLPADRPGDPIY